MSKSDLSQDVSGGDAIQRSVAPLTAVLDLVGRVVALTSLLVAVLFYFGYVRTNALYQFFGVDQTVLEFSTQDYLLRSIQVTAQLVRWILVVALLVVWGDFVINRWLEHSADLHPRWRAQLAGLIATLGLLLVAANLIATWFDVQYPMKPMFYPLTWTVGISLGGYGFYLFTQPKPNRRKSHASTESGLDASRQMRRISLWLFAGLFIFSLFWTVSISAYEAGQLGARQIATYLKTQPDVIIYSQDLLNLQAPGISLDRECQSPDVCQYRYSGLKFLVRSGGKYFLLPVGWSPTNAVTIILPDTNTIRVEVASGVPPRLTP